MKSWLPAMAMLDRFAAPRSSISVRRISALDSSTYTRRRGFADRLCRGCGGEQRTSLFVQIVVQRILPVLCPQAATVLSRPSPYTTKNFFMSAAATSLVRMSLLLLI